MLVEQLGRVLLYNYLPLEIQPGTEAPVLMRISRIAVNASVLAALVWIDGIHHHNIGAFNLVHNFLGCFVEKLRTLLLQKIIVNSFYMLLHINVLCKRVVGVDLCPASFKIGLFLGFIH